MPPLKAQLLLEESLSAYFPEMVFTDSGITVQLHRNTQRRAILTNQSPGIAPGLDQHAACELNQRGKLVCPRQGAAVDLIYPGKNSYQVALWLAQHTPFDRLYLYGPDRPLHISYGPEQNRALVELTTHHERRIPKRLTLTQLKGMC